MSDPTIVHARDELSEIDLSAIGSGPHRFRRTKNPSQLYDVVCLCPDDQLVVFVRKQPLRPESN